MTDCTNIAYNFVTGSLNALINLFFLIGWSSKTFSVGSTCKSKYDRKYYSSDSNCFNVLSIHLPRLSHLVEKRLMTFIISFSLNSMNSRNWDLIENRNDRKYQSQNLEYWLRIALLLFKQKYGQDDMDNKHQKLFVLPESPQFSSARCCDVQPWSLYCLRCMLHICSNLIRSFQLPYSLF